MTEEERLRHCVKLGMIAVDAIRNPGWDLREADDREYEDNITMLKIMADAFVALAKRQDMLPKFRVQTPAPSQSNTLSSLPLDAEREEFVGFSTVMGG